ncbi:hypothetical protein QIS74_07245 [Colletotrichum tabaci]|uniref:Uncharacterized protein n=1 Tax=Colletotrichum tabaci TaxID=1209068 RepID=A0AAV9TDW6_9PEZI
MAVVYKSGDHAPGEDDCEGCRKIQEELTGLSVGSESSEEYEDG